ncbi:hypothetical protein BJ508DRAFT_307225 [Ascobolus immersus RN42]|uniref:WSC domain-containing protein n=1 Tax=Ascobolus immersus RN42 TaxID=1160509 RepID=A0A3N4I3V3_ASCIM|nr:hypothetical protein BJ508DRAFT_307225 [Ascobolus immersus RN42]
MKLLSTITATVILAAINVSALVQTDLGCYKFDDTEYEKSGPTPDNNSSGECMKYCENLKGTFSVAAMVQATCYCGNYAPVNKVDNKKCDSPCPGYGLQTCGSILGEYINVWQTGYGQIKRRPPKSSSSSTSAQPTSTSSSGSPSESPTEKPVETEKPEEKKSSGVSKAGAAAGAVVGVLALAAMIGGGILFYKRRKQQKVEEEYRRTLAVQSFGKKPEADHRLEPVMLQRRASDGSIADNEDYSRRILKVGFYT